MRKKLSNNEVNLVCAITKVQQDILKEYTETVIPVGIKGDVPEHVVKRLRETMALYFELNVVIEKITGEKIKPMAQSNAKLYLINQVN